MMPDDTTDDVDTITTAELAHDLAATTLEEPAAADQPVYSSVWNDGQTAWMLILTGSRLMRVMLPPGKKHLNAFLEDLEAATDPESPADHRDPHEVIGDHKKVKLVVDEEIASLHDIRWRDDNAQQVKLTTDNGKGGTKNIAIGVGAEDLYPLIGLLSAVARETGREPVASSQPLSFSETITSAVLALAFIWIVVLAVAWFLGPNGPNRVPVILLPLLWLGNFGTTIIASLLSLFVGLSTLKKLKNRPDKHMIALT